MDLHDALRRTGVTVEGVSDHAMRALADAHAADLVAEAARLWCAAHPEAAEEARAQAAEHGGPATSSHHFLWLAERAANQVILGDER